MKITFLIGMAISVLVTAGTSTHAQISDNDSSAAVLAAYCAQSSGLPASNYESYCRELAKTIGQLPAVAQHRVFEDKMPVVADTAGFGDARDASDQARANAASGSAVGQTVEDTNGEATETSQDDTGSNQENASHSNAGGNQTDSGSSGGSKSSSKSRGILDIVGAINEFLFGS